MPFKIARFVPSHEWQLVLAFRDDASAVRHHTVAQLGRLQQVAGGWIR